MSVLVRSAFDSLEDFLGTLSTQFTRLAARFPALLGVMADGFTYRPSYEHRHAQPTAWMGLLDASPLHVFVAKRWGRNFRLLPIDYASRPRLRDRLTLR